MIEIRPLAGAGPLNFGMSADQTAERLGEPLAATTNRQSELVHRYSTMFLTFDDHGLAELSILPEGQPYMLLQNPLTRSGLAELISEDGDAKEIVCCVVLLKLGLAVTGVHDGDQSQLAATAFRLGRWDKLRDGMRSFSRTEI